MLQVRIVDSAKLWAESLQCDRDTLWVCCGIDNGTFFARFYVPNGRLQMLVTTIYKDFEMTFSICRKFVSISADLQTILERLSGPDSMPMEIKSQVEMPEY